MGKVIIDPSSPVWHELLVIELCEAEAENCDVEDTGQMSSDVEIQLQMSHNACSPKVKISPVFQSI